MSVAQLLACSVENRVNTITFSMSTAQTCLIRWPFIIGSGSVDSFLLSDMGFYRNATTILNAPNAMTVVSAAVENGVTSVPVKKGGSRTWVINPGDNDSQSDLITASQFSLSSIPVGTVLWLKMKVSFATTALSMIVSPRLTTQVSGSQSLAYDSAVTTPVNDVDNIGPFTTTGTAPTSRSFAYCPIMLGYYSGTVAPKVLFASGDSIFEGVGDQTFTAGGGGMFQRALYNNNTNVLSGINFAKASSLGQGANTAPGNLVFYWARYCNMGFDETGTNDFGASGGGGITAATMLGRTQTSSTLMKAQGTILKTFRTKLGCSTTSTDSWATDANQTIQSSWDAGQPVDQFNIATSTLIPTYYDVVIPMNAWRSAGNVYKWVNDGATANFATTDGIHPKTTYHALLGAEIRSAIDATPLYPTPTPDPTVLYTGSFNNLPVTNVAVL